MKQNKKSIIIIAVILIILIIAGLLIFFGTRGSKEQPFLSPVGLCVDEEGGGLYVSDEGTKTILWFDGQKAKTIAVKELPYCDDAPIGGYQDGLAENALFDEPVALIPWMDGIVVSDSENHALRYIANGEVKSLFDRRTVPQPDGTERNLFEEPFGLAVDDEGYLYVADSVLGCISRIGQDGSIHVIVDGMECPTGLCWADGYLYITDRGTNQIYRWANQYLQVVAGSGSEGLEDGSVITASFCAPSGIVSYDGCLYIADSGNSSVRKIEGDQVTTILTMDENKNNLWPVRPVGITVLDGKLYIADAFAGVVLPLDI